MSPIIQKWTRCQQPNCEAILQFQGTRQHLIELADRGDLEGLCPIHAIQPIPWALQMEIAEALAVPAPANFPERIPVKRATSESAAATLDRRKPLHRCVLKTGANANKAASSF